MAEQLVPDDIWDAIAPLLPAHPPQPNGGRPWISDRAVLGGLIYVLRSSTPWRLLPAGRWAAAAVSPVGGGCGPGKPLECGSSCTIGCWPGWVTTARSTGQGRRSTAPACGPSMGGLTGPNPVDRGKAGSKYHLLIDSRGIPLAVGLSAANTHDSQLLEQLVDAVPPVKGPRGRPGRPRRRPAKLHADKGYDDPRCRQVLRRRGISPRIARRGIESSERLGRHRWRVERSLAWLVDFRYLQVRHGRRADYLQGFLHLACALICARYLQPL